MCNQVLLEKLRQCSISLSLSLSLTLTHTHTNTHTHTQIISTAKVMRLMSVMLDVPGDIMDLNTLTKCLLQVLLTCC
jgi:hypothetical protein